MSFFGNMNSLRVMENSSYRHSSYRSSTACIYTHTHTHTHTHTPLYPNQHTVCGIKKEKFNSKGFTKHTTSNVFSFYISNLQWCSSIRIVTSERSGLASSAP
jgi:hypothetical protein